MDNFTEKEFEEIYNFIKSKLIIDKEVCNEQIVYVLGGQPGAGKSTLTSRIEEKMKNNIIAINGDDFRSYHPKYKNLVKAYGDDSVLYTQKFSNAITEKLIEDLGNEKYNLIVEGTLRTSEVPLKTSRLLHDKGYNTNLSIVCVKPEFSYLGTLERYQKMKENGFIARATPKEAHDNVVANFAENLSKIYSEKEFDNIEIFTREGKSLYLLKETPNINPGKIIQKEFDRELTIEEKKKLIGSYKKIKEKLNENDKNFQEVTKFLRTVNKNYNCFTGNQINIEAHSSAENKWISKKETKKYGIKVEEGAKETIGQITYIKNNKLYQKPVSFYNISDLKITKEIEQKFVPIKEKEKAQEISKSKGQEIGD